MMKNDNIKLGQVAEFRNGVNYDESNFGKGIKIINVANFKDYSTPKYEELGEINPNDLIKEGDLLQKGDIVFVRSNGNKNLIGRTLYIDEIDEDLTYSAFCIRARFTSKKCNPKFYSYLFKTDFIRKTLSSQGNGTNISNLNQKILNNLEVPLLSMDKQNKIVSILSKYDELIENNLKRIKLLEESTELIYKEWFVNLRFPGYEKCNIVNGIPVGWKKTTISDIATIQGGYAFKSKEWQQTGNPVIKIKNINDNSIDIVNCECISDEVADKAKAYKLNEGDLLIAMTGATVGKIGIMQRINKSYYLNQRVGRIMSNYEYDISSYLFSIFNSNTTKQNVLNLANGSAQPNISAGEIGSISILLPSDDILLKYTEIANKLLNKRLVLIEQNEKLKEARDILIPRLISGEIEV